jgi:hypothetical protein
MSFLEEFKGYLVADPDVAYSRLQICLGCEHLQKHTRCDKCGCFMKVKTKLTYAKCPIGKW